MKKKVVATKSMALGELLAINPGVAEILMGFGLHCFSCPLSQMETLEEAAMVHGVDVDYMLKKINEFLNQK